MVISDWYVLFCTSFDYVSFAKKSLNPNTIYMKSSYFIGLFLLFSIHLVAQKNFGGRPFLSPEESWSVINVSTQKMPQLPHYASRENSVSAKENAQALRFAHPFFVELTPQNSGVWSENEVGDAIWHLAITSEGAYSLNLIFDRFELVEGAQLYLFNAEQSVVLGAFTSENNNESGMLATSPLPGETIVIELQEPAGATKSSQLLIGAVNHDYLNLFSTLGIESSRFQVSESCHPEFSCLNDETLLNVGKSVCRIIVDGTTLCSGTLLNNSAQDKKPYVLTAAHCLDNSNDFQTTIFTFNYESPNCASFIEGNFLQTLSGSHLRSYIKELDIALLEIAETPPTTYQPVWAGWSRSSTISTPVTTIHHPEADVKKVTQSNNTPVKASFMTTLFLPDSHWRVEQWASGSTEGGSSGAGLFNAQGYLVGSLSGGNSSCAHPFNDNFSRFEKAWNYFETPSKQLANWLDPLGNDLIELPPLEASNDDVKRISNYLPTDVPALQQLTNQQGEGYWGGHNSRQDRAVAEAFGPFSQGELYGVWLLPGLSKNTNNQSVNIKIWQGVHLPQTQLSAVNGLQLSKIKSNREHLVMLPQPVSVSGNIWVEVELNYDLNTDTLALYSSLENSSRTKNRFWVKDFTSTWIKGSDFIGYPSSLWVDLMMSNVLLSDTLINENRIDSFTIYPNPANQFVNIFWENLNQLCSISVYNFAGKLHQKKSCRFNDGYASLDVDNLPSGFYIIKIEADNMQRTAKIAVVR